MSGGGGGEFLMQQGVVLVTRCWCCPLLGCLGTLAPCADMNSRMHVFGFVLCFVFVIYEVRLSFPSLFVLSVFIVFLCFVFSFRSRVFSVCICCIIVFRLFLV